MTQNTDQLKTDKFDYTEIKPCMGKTRHFCLGKKNLQKQSKTNEKLRHISQIKNKYNSYIKYGHIKQRKKIARQKNEQQK